MYVKALAGNHSEDCRLDSSVLDNPCGSSISGTKPKRSVWDRDKVPRKVHASKYYIAKNHLVCFDPKEPVH